MVPAIPIVMSIASASPAACFSERVDRRVGAGGNACRDSKPHEGKLQIGRVIGLCFLGAVAHGLGDEGVPCSGGPVPQSATQHENAQREHRHDDERDPE